MGAGGIGMGWLVALLNLGVWLLTAALYTSLPEQIPGHFGLYARPTRWDNRETIWILPFIASLMALGLYGLNRTILKYPGLINLPNKDEFMRLPPDSMRRVVQRLNLHLIGLMATLQLLLGFLVWGTAQVASGISSHLSGAIWLFPLAVAVQVGWLVFDLKNSVAREHQRTL
jgi:hypothetical protein